MEDGMGERLGQAEGMQRKGSSWHTDQLKTYAHPKLQSLGSVAPGSQPNRGEGAASGTGQRELCLWFLTHGWGTTAYSTGGRWKRGLRACLCAT